MDDQDSTQPVFTQDDSGSEATPLVTGPAQPTVTPGDQEANNDQDDLARDTQSLPGACPTKYRIDQIRLNSNFAWNSYRCAFEDSRPIIAKFGTRHDSRTVVTCTKFRYDRPIIIEIRGTRIFSKFLIRSNLSIRYLVGQAPGPDAAEVTSATTATAQVGPYAHSTGKVYADMDAMVIYVQKNNFLHV